jgi:hypothetical protein
MIHDGILIIMAIFCGSPNHSEWGLDMVGKLHKSWPGGHVYMLVAVDKFTKWVEAAPVTTQDSIATINFIKSIVFSLRSAA